MKKLIVLLSVVCSLPMLAQENTTKNDIIVTKDGQLIQAKVVKVTENTVSFNYPGEGVVNEVKAGSLEKIVFASGRTQNFGPASSKIVKIQDENTPIPAEEIYLGPGSDYDSAYTENTLTVLPLSYIKNGVHDKKLSNQMTTFVTAFMASNAKPYGISVPDMTVTIEKLVDADIGYQKLVEASPAELREVLGSEFILRAKLSDNTSRNPGRNIYSDSENTGFKTDIKIDLELFGAEDDEEKYEVSFSEDISLKESSIVLEGKWKSSIKYVLQQLLSSKSL